MIFVRVAIPSLSYPIVSTARQYWIGLVLVSLMILRVYLYSACAELVVAVVVSVCEVQWLPSHAPYLIVTARLTTLVPYSFVTVVVSPVPLLFPTSVHCDCKFPPHSWQHYPNRHHHPYVYFHDSYYYYYYYCCGCYCNTHDPLLLLVTIRPLVVPTIPSYSMPYEVHFHSRRLLVGTIVATIHVHFFHYSYCHYFHCSCCCCCCCYYESTS